MPGEIVFPLASNLAYLAKLVTLQSTLGELLAMPDKTAFPLTTDYVVGPSVSVNSGHEETRTCSGAGVPEQKSKNTGVESEIMIKDRACKPDYAYRDLAYI